MPSWACPSTGEIDELLNVHNRTKTGYVVKKDVPPRVASARFETLLDQDMADATQRADEWIEESPAIEILNDIASRLGTLFAIRGGVVRNLLARAVASDDEIRCGLFDLVDPLSDIDIVAPTVEVLESVLLQIHARLPLAGFHAWEAKTWMQVERFEATAPHTPLDRAQIVIDGRKPHLAQHEAAVKVLESGSLWLQRACGRSIRSTARCSRCAPGASCRSSRCSPSTDWSVFLTSARWRCARATT